MKPAKRIALVAHDTKKSEMIDRVRANAAAVIGGRYGTTA